MALQNLFVRGAVTGQNPQFLVGRKDMIRNLANRLSEDRISGAIYGSRGVGKTSIAWQVATLLAGTNSRFKRKEYLNDTGASDFIVVFHKCSRFIDTIGDLLLEIILANSSDYSFSRMLGPYLKEHQNYTGLSKKFSIGIPKVAEYSVEEKSTGSSGIDEAKRLFGSETEKTSFFLDLMYEVSKTARSKKVLFVVDEFDRPRDFRGGKKLNSGEKKDIEGVGELVKDSDFAQFLFVGIAENVAEILGDHKSAARKMPGTIVQAPYLSEDEIKEIYDRAVDASRGKLTISDDFIERAVNYSFGLPWIAQHLGYEAVRDVGESASLSISDFRPALDRTIETYAHEAEISESIEFFSQAHRTDLEILGVIWDRHLGEDEYEIRKALPQKFKQHFDVSLKRLLSRGIVIRRSSRVLFRDPLVRVFSRKYIDDARI